jgi:AcrR family transcriptional regulator
MPRALTEQEKCVQCQRLMDKGKAIVLSQGIKKVSVDEIAKAAGMSKGSFYQHFESKEQFLFKLIEHIYLQIFTQAEQILRSISDIQVNARSIFTSIFHVPEMAFFIQNEKEISELFFTVIPNHELQSFKQMEAGMFEKMLFLAGVNIEKVKPGVVHNYVHTLYLLMGSDLMIKDDLQKTVDLILDSLISYIIEGTR